MYLLPFHFDFDRSEQVSCFSERPNGCSFYRNLNDLLGKPSVNASWKGQEP